MAEKINLTDRKLQSLPPAKPGERYEIWDTDTRGLGIRVTAAKDGKGKAARRMFVYRARYPSGSNPTRRALGEYGPLTLQDARAKAALWHDLIKRGIDPSKEEERTREKAAEEVAAAARAKAERGSLTFGPAVEEYIVRHVRKTRTGKHTEREIRRELLPRWRDKLVAEISEDDVVRMVREIADRGAAYQAHNLFSHVRAFYSWLIGTGGRAKYGFQIAPTYGLRPTKLIGEKKPRQRTLAQKRDNNDEIVAYWRAAQRMRYPAGPFLALLLLTGCRKSEVAGARWHEFHPELVRTLRDHARSGNPIDWKSIPADWRTWTIPAERFKSDSQHLVPLTDDALAILATLPWLSAGDCLFSTTFGRIPINQFTKLKVKLDGRMLRTLKALARRRGDDPAGVELTPFVVHDVRRTVRTKLAALKVPPHVAEMLIGHGRRGLTRVYDIHDHLPELSDAAATWAAHLRSIVDPPPDNVLRLARA